MNRKNIYMNKLIEYRKNGWVFRYDASTKFIGAYHPNGGKQSICELNNVFGNDDFGFIIENLLNRTNT